MELFGIKWAPLNIPIERRLQTLAAFAWVVTILLGGILGAILALYLIIYTSLSWLVALYLFWMYLDRNTSENGGRIQPSVRSWKWWKYLKDYFPLKLVKSKNFDLNPRKNYLFGCFPHGIVPSGPFSAFATNYGNFEEHFPHHERYIVTLPQQFILPFCRELLLSLGGVSSSQKSIEHILGKPNGGNVLVLVIGGARESYYCKPGMNTLVLKQRKGFIKLALKNGSPLVPVFSFGETNLYDQLDGPVIRKIQEALRKWIVIAPVLLVGRGFFQYSFGLVPRRRPVTTVVGEPIEIPKIEKPSQEDVDKYHSIFMEKLTDLFEEHKYKYLENPESKELIII